MPESCLPAEEGAGEGAWIALRLALAIGSSVVREARARVAPEERARVAPIGLRLATVADSSAIMRIYNHEVAHTTVTFDITPRSLEEQSEWIQQRQGALGVIVAETEGRVVGFASLSPYRARPAYRTTVEDSVYVEADSRGAGVGRALLEELIEMAVARGFHSMIARIAGGHGASLALHKACGFEMVGIEREVGRKFGTWLDAIVLQRMLNE